MLTQSPFRRLLLAGVMIATAAVGSACGTRDGSPTASSSTAILGAVEELPSPAPAGSKTPVVIADDSGAAYLSWTEQRVDSSFAIRLAKWNGTTWDSSRTVAADLPFFVNWADFPAIVKLGNGDLAAHRFLMEELRKARPGDSVLSEEGSDDRTRVSADRVWIVDPLDGTNEYGEQGRPDWAVHVALWERGELTAGAVSLPAVGSVFSTDPPPAMEPYGREQPIIVTSRNRTPFLAIAIGRALGCNAIRLGSAGAKTMAVILGHADIYAHDGGMYQWDSAAPAAVAKAAGLHVSRIDGSPLEYNAADPWLPDFLVCRQELADDVLAAVREA